MMKVQNNDNNRRNMIFRIERNQVQIAKTRRFFFLKMHEQKLITLIQLSGTPALSSPPFRQ